MKRIRKRWIALAVFLVGAMVVAGLLISGADRVSQWIGREIVQQIERKTGARVELGGFHISPLRLRARMDDLTVHGLEPADAPPMFHADHVEIGLRIISFFGRKIALDRLIVDRPEVAIRVGPDGGSNLPHPAAPRASRPWQQTLFSLQIGELALRDGTLAFNDRRTPLAIRGENLEFTLQYAVPVAGEQAYVGNLLLRRVQVVARRDAPFRFDLSAKFTLRPGSFDLGEMICVLPHSELHLSAQLPSFARPDWNVRYRGTISLADVRTIFRQPTTPDGIADFSGQGRYASGEWTASGHYRAHEIRMRYPWFHTAGMETWGDYEVARQHLVVPNLRIRALDGSADGRLDMAFHGLAFRTETRLRGASLAGILAALDHDGFPVNTMHWDGSVDVDSVNTWNANFKHFRTRGQTRWSARVPAAAGKVQAAANVDYDYASDRRMVTLQQGTISTPNTQIGFDGTLGADDSALDVDFRTSRLLDWDDFINAIRGSDAEPQRVAGSVEWRGRLLGPLGGPTFAGRVQATNASYAGYYWDALAGEMQYSPDGFRLSNATVQHGQASARVNLSLDFDGDWGFLPASAWRLDVLTSRAPTADLQAVLGTQYPLTGLMSGDFQGSGTRADPVLDSNFVLDAARAGGFQFDRLSGRLHLQHDEIQLSSAELRTGPGRISGSILYHPAEQQASFEIAGTDLALAKIPRLQTAALPIAGQLDFDLKGSGPLTAPFAQGTLRLANLRIGSEQQGDFRADLTSDGHTANLAITSELTHGKLQGQLSIGLHDGEPLSGHLSVQQFDLDPLIASGLHLSQLTSHSSVDGLFTLSGSLRAPDTIEVDADIQRIAFDYEFVHLTNDQDIKLSYQRNQIRIEQAHLHGPDTDLRVSGSARFDGDRPLHFAFSGSADLRLIRGIFPLLDTQGSAEANVSVEGTMEHPRITGRATIRDASAHYGDFPIGLNQPQWRPCLRPQPPALRPRLRGIRRRPIDAGRQRHLRRGAAALPGHRHHALRAHPLSRRHELARRRHDRTFGDQRGGLAQRSGPIAAPAFCAGRGCCFFLRGRVRNRGRRPRPHLPFLQNLAFDIEGQTLPGAQIEWTGAHVEMDGDVRLRGTWDRPVLLGNMHLLDGEMPFRGNTFQLTRGDINFANPFRLDPVLNVEATSTISQYQVTIDFSGPASHLALNYRSDPPLPDSDIIALLALGSPGRIGGLAVRIHQFAELRRHGFAFGGDFHRHRRAHRASLRNQPVPRGPVCGGHDHGIQRRGARHHSRAGDARSDDYLFDERRDFKPVSVDSGGVRGQARSLRRFPAGYQRHKRLRHQVGETLQVVDRGDPRWP